MSDLMKLQVTAPSGRRIGRWGTLQKGDELTVPAAMGKRLIRAGGFKEVDPPAPPAPPKSKPTKKEG